MIKHFNIVNAPRPDFIDEHVGKSADCGHFSGFSDSIVGAVRE